MDRGRWEGFHLSGACAVRHWAYAQTAADLRSKHWEIPAVSTKRSGALSQASQAGLERDSPFGELVSGNRGVEAVCP